MALLCQVDCRHEFSNLPKHIAELSSSLHQVSSMRAGDKFENLQCTSQYKVDNQVNGIQRCSMINRKFSSAFPGYESKFVGLFLQY